MTATTKTEVTALTVVERAAVALGSSKLEGELVALAAKSADIVEIKNAAAREQCHSAMMALANTRTGITKAGKAARDDANAFSKAVIAEQDRLVGLIEPEESRLRGLRDGWDEEREAEKEAARAAEAARVERLRGALQALRDIPLSMVGRSAADISAVFTSMQSRELSKQDFGEFMAEAAQIKADVIAKLETLHAQVAEAEATAKRAAEERAEQERQRAVREAEERAAKADADAKAAADRAELERQQAEVRKQQEELDRQRAEVKRQQDAAEKAERERKEAELCRANEEREAAERTAREQEAAAARELADANHAEFLRTGPGAAAIIAAVAEHFDVMETDALRWITSYTFEPMEKAA